ncbi:uncharacterized protein AMSG_09752 [Thecamonas trahens ATCC 50062]|uniref:PA14 domain-containing protein n=1 Tax=Thecamonas trahens ATCC 50062 TaxID=461836 RepID=A0A0L0DP66_THETB|nr:hypothetical protein AMSG_09752 [Thecamonas trahens ATCC 50062]KNC54087.1 hypothetical protein AMSG_09752 [Thecamonas trahens ATCC 50062]|eukprot:XP_013754096.1 hypothetical protein AMSG_09752 [Thecamonas trahens ATCC 50062]
MALGKDVKMRKVVLAVVMLALICGEWLLVAGDGTDILGVQQALRSETIMFIDVADFNSEEIRWFGRDSLSIFRPSDSQLVATLTSGATPASYTPTENGAYRLQLNADQVAGDVWDVTIHNTLLVMDVGGRLWSRQWFFAAASFAETDATDVSMWAVFLTSLGNKLVETRFEGLAGFVYELGATSNGIATNTPAYKSSPQAGHAITPEIPLYLRPPNHIPLADTQPTIEFDDVLYVTVGCGAFTTECTTLVSGQVNPRFRFFTDAAGGAYRIVCDTNSDGVFNIVDGSDTVLSGTTVAGANEVTWDGTDSSGASVSNGYYLCEVWVFLAEIHFPMVDVETIYPGMRMFSYFEGVPRPQIMYWNDDDVINPPATPVNMPNGQPGDTDSGCCGFNSTYDATAVANVNARAWGNFASGSKGDQAIINTFSFVERSISVPLNVSVGVSDSCPPAAVYVLNEEVMEGDTGTVSVMVSLVLTSVVSAPVDIDYATVDGSASAGSDYVAAAGTVTLVPNTYCYSISVDVNTDNVLEVDEQFFIDISYNGGGPSPVEFRQSRAVVTIRNDDSNCGATAPVPVEWPGLLLEVYDDVTGTEVSDLTSSNAYLTHSPGCVDPELNTLEANPASGACAATLVSSLNYGVEASGWLRVGQTDTYTFVVAGDNSVELWLGPDEASLARVAFNILPNADENSYNDAPPQTSSPMALAANELLFIRVLFKEGDEENPSDDFFSVAWYGTTVSTNVAVVGNGGFYSEMLFHNNTIDVEFESDDTCCTSRIVETEVRAVRTEADPCSGQLFGNVTNMIDLSPRAVSVNVDFEPDEVHELEYVRDDLFADIGAVDVTGQVFAGRVRHPLTTKSRIASGNDNAFERAGDGRVWNSWGTLPIGTWTLATTFDSIGVPQGATITRAYIEVEGDNGGGQDTGTGVDVPIWGHAVDSGSSIPETDFYITSLPQTSATVTWTEVPEFVTNARYQSVDIAPIVQELVSRSGWRGGNSMTIVFGLSTGTSNIRLVESVNGDASAAPTLVIEYHTGFGTSANTGAVYLGDYSDTAVGTVNSLSGGFRLNFVLAAAGSYTFSVRHSVVANRLDAGSERVSALLRVNNVYFGNGVGTEGVQVLEELTASGVSTPTTSSFTLSLPAGASEIVFGGYLSRRSGVRDYAAVFFDDMVLSTTDFVSSCSTANLEYSYEWWAPSCSLTAPCSTTQLSSGLCDPEIRLFAQNEVCCLEVNVALPKEIPPLSFNVSDVAASEPSSGFVDYIVALSLGFDAEIEIVAVLETVNGTALSGFDFALVTPTVVFPVGTETANAVVRVYQDGVYEGHAESAPPETFVVRLRV